MRAPATLRRPSLSLLGLRDPARTPARLSRVDIGSHPARTTFVVPRALNRRAVPQPKLRAALLGLPLPLRVHHREPVPSRRFPGWADDTSSPGLFLPYDTLPSRGIRLPVADPSATAMPRAGFGYPLRGYYLRPCRRLRVGASMGFTLQGLPFVAIGSPLGARTLLPLPTASAKSRGTLLPQRGRLQGLAPATNPCSRQDHEWSWPSIPSWVSALQSLLPCDLALAFVAAPPLLPLGGMTSQPAWTSGSCGTHGSVDPSPDHQLSWASLPFDDHGAPFIAPWGGLISSPHTRRHRSGVGRSMPLGRDATSDPGPAARHRRHSACDR